MLNRSGAYWTAHQPSYSFTDLIRQHQLENSAPADAGKWSELLSRPSARRPTVSDHVQRHQLCAINPYSQPFPVPVFEFWQHFGRVRDVQGVTGSKANAVTTREQIDFLAGSQQIALWKHKLWLTAGSNAITCL